MTNKILLPVGSSLRSLAAVLPFALLFGMTGCIAEADEPDAAEEPLSSEQDAALSSGVALKEVTYRITDDVSTSLVTADRPGRTMDAAGNATMSWVYGRSNVVGVCDNLAARIGLKSEQELFSGGVCLKVNGYSSVFRVADKLEDGQACGDPSRQHLDVHRKEFDGISGFVKSHGDARIRLVDCGSETAKTRVIFEDWDRGSEKHKVIRFYGLPAPVTSVSLHMSGGKVLNGMSVGAGQFLFEDFQGADIVGSHALTVKLRHADGSRETATITVDFPTAGQIHQFQVKGNDVHRQGTLDLLEIHQGETRAKALARAQDRKDCISYLTSHPSASSADAAAHGHCGS